MAENDVVAFLEEWQTGVLFVLGSALVGVVFGGIAGSTWSGSAGVLGFAAGAAVAFLLFSYLSYGR